ncbi:MAG TPA: preprotein translocase subunit SecA, partial [Holophaga sp.]|nr:preprotein translocase subunit SecA [Holophaga sp.]
RIAGEIVEGLVMDYMPAKGEKDIEGFKERFEQLYALSDLDGEALAAMSQTEAVDTLAERVKQVYLEKEARLGSEDILRWHERVAILQIIDSAWKRHLLVMDHLKEAIGFRGYGQKDPLVEYKKESYDYFEQMRFGYEDEIISYLYRVEPQPTYMPEEDFFREAPDMQELGPDELGAIVNQSGLDGIHRVLRFSAGGVDEDEPDPRR